MRHRVEQNKIVHIHFANGEELGGSDETSFLARSNVWDYEGSCCYSVYLNLTMY